MVDCDRVKLLYSAAKLIKSEITDCLCISIRPPSVVDLSLTKAESLIPDSLHWLLRWVIIAKLEKEDDDDFESPSSRNSSDERRILMLAQDVVHCATPARVNMPKHVALGIICSSSHDKVETAHHHAQYNGTL